MAATELPGEFALLVWFKAHDSGGKRCLVSFNDRKGDAVLSVHIVNSNSIAVRLHGRVFSHPYQFITARTAPFTDGRWHSLVLSRWHRRAKVFVDGEIVASALDDA